MWFIPSTQFNASKIISKKNFGKLNAIHQIHQFFLLYGISSRNDDYDLCELYA